MSRRRKRIERTIALIRDHYAAPDPDVSMNIRRMTARLRKQWIGQGRP